MELLISSVAVLVAGTGVAIYVADGAKNASFLWDFF
jgi:hypothetical protein